MANVKVRKTRQIRNGARLDPFPTAESIVRNVLAGVVVGVAERAIDKAFSKFGLRRPAPVSAPPPNVRPPRKPRPKKAA